jgi:hypothetical protein
MFNHRDWSALSNFVSITSNTLNDDNVGGKLAVNSNMLPEGSFQIHLGKLFLALHNKDRVLFHKEINECRLEVSCL